MSHQTSEGRPKMKKRWIEKSMREWLTEAMEVGKGAIDMQLPKMGVRCEESDWKRRGVM